MPPLPQGEVLIHAGDFSETGTLKQIQDFVAWFDAQPHPERIFIAGNHDTSLHPSYYCAKGATRFHPRSGQDPITYSNQCCDIVRTRKSVYLEDSSCEIVTSGEAFRVQQTQGAPQESDRSILVYGSPWQPEFCDWAFNANRGPELIGIWSRIPPDTDLLITHGPPLGYGDLTEDGVRCGCSDLLDNLRARSSPPRVHVFGHIHEGYGNH